MNPEKSREKFNGLVDKIFLNLLNKKPEPILHDFLKKYFPPFLDPASTEWNFYPPNKETQFPLKTEHNLVLETHPFITFKLSEVRFEFFSIENKDSLPAFPKPRICFTFSHIEEAEKCLDFFIEEFEKVSASSGKKIINEHPFYRFSFLENTESPVRIELSLFKDLSENDPYKLYVAIGNIKNKR
ncbi:MAG: hypothetical protein QM737_17280 [Ferruginibacter sp.]